MIRGLKTVSKSIHSSATRRERYHARIPNWFVTERLHSLCDLAPCTRCARSLIQAGVVEVVYPRESDVPERWLADFEMSTQMMGEAGLRFGRPEQWFEPLVMIQYRRR